MKPRDEVVQELVGRWLAKAAEDLAVARLILDSGQSLFAQAAFHAQQAVEKLLKAYLTHHQCEFSKTHDLSLLLDLVGEIDEGLASRTEQVRQLNPYAVEVRYPGEALPLSAERSRELLKIAVACQDEILQSLGG